MVLVINKSDFFPLNIVVGNYYFFEESSLELKTNLLENALEKLDNDIDSFIKKVGDVKYQEFLWKFTYNDYRKDNITDTVLDYYILEIVNYLFINYRFDKIEIQCSLNNSLIESLSKISTLELRFSKTKNYILNKFLRNYVGPLKYIFKYFLHIFKYKNFRDNELNKAIFLSHEFFEVKRYKKFPKMIDGIMDIYFLNMPLTKLKNYSNSNQYLVKSHTLLTFTRGFYKAIKIHLFKGKALKNYNPMKIYCQNLSEESFTKTLYLSIRYEALKYLFLNLKPKYLIVSTTVGDPKNRMALSIAKELNIKTIVFSCRPMLSKLRSEDRVIKSDFIYEKDNFFTDFFIVFDKLSKKHLLSYKVDDNRIITYSDTMKEKMDQVLFSKGILILFSGDEYNDKIFSLIENLTRQGILFDTIYYRKHPTLKISEQQLNQLLKKIEKNCNELICISNYNWNDITFKDIIAVTSESTSGIDACSRGASVVWLPFLGLNSLSFKPMMDAIGKTSYDENEFYEFLQSIKDDKVRLEFNKQCEIQYRENIYLDSNMPEFISEL